MNKGLIRDDSVLRSLVQNHDDEEVSQTIKLTGQIQRKGDANKPRRSTLKREKLIGSQKSKEAKRQ